MPDPRLQKFAQLLVRYSLEIQPGQKLMINSTPLAEELLREVYAEALQAGAHAYIQMELPDAWELFYKHADGFQLDFVSPIYQLVLETFDAQLSIDAPRNTRALSGIDASRMARRLSAYRPVRQKFFDRTARGEVRWCSTLFPSDASAQEADMSLAEYREFVYAAGKLNAADPVAEWQAEGRRQRELVDWLAWRDQVVLKGADIDLRLSIRGRRFEVSDGKFNFPDGEIFTGPVEESVSGWVRFRYPAIWGGREVENVELWFEDGQVVREQASKGQELLARMLSTDPGARRLGEWGIGTNYDILKFSKNMLFDEKLGGTVHFALGASYPETGGKNESGVHWDLLCDMADSEITVDGEVFYRNGRPVVAPG